MTVGRIPDEIDGPADAGLAGRVARLFFDRQLTKIEIAARLGISRFRVARLLDHARSSGVVRIEYRDAPPQDHGLGRAVEQRFALAHGVVAGADADDMAVARLAADYVDDQLGRGGSIGIAWGSTVGRVVRAMPARDDPGIDIVQLAGSSTSLDRGTDAGDLALFLGERLGAGCHRIHAPAFVESAELRAALLRQPEIAATTARFGSLDVALLGIGAFGPPGTAPSSSLLRSGALAGTDLARLTQLGAIGDLLVHPFDADGRFVSPELGQRSIAISIAELRRVPSVIAVANGLAKVEAIRGALAAGVINVLVTDAPTAEAMLATRGSGR